MIQQQKAKLKGIADVVFCIDFSGSMTPCIEGVKDHVTTFVQSLETGSPNVKIDWRIGFCAYDSATFIVQDFVTDAHLFAERLGKLDTMGDEFTPGAMDFCISDFPWRKGCNRFLIVFTDETLTGGANASEAAGRFPDLLKKIEATKTRLFFFGPKDPYYSQFEHVPRSAVQYLEDSDFSTVDFSKLLSSLGKTVSQSCGQQQGGASGVVRPIYDLSGISIRRL